MPTQSNMASVTLNLERLRFRCVCTAGQSARGSQYVQFPRPGCPLYRRGSGLYGRRPSSRRGALLGRCRTGHDHCEDCRAPVVINDGSAVRYPVAVGRPAKQWVGKVAVAGKHLRPAWSPPEEVRLDNPDLPDVIPGGAPNNPMGVVALTLSGGEYAIHGTNRPESIGKYASCGCIRMYNEDIAHLFQRVSVGTPWW